MTVSLDPEMKSLGRSISDKLTTSEKVFLFDVVFSGRYHFSSEERNLWEEKFSQFADEMLTFNLRKEDGIKSIDKSTIEFGDLRESGVRYNDVEF